MNNKENNKISWICAECGREYGRKKCDKAATWHEGTCDVCGRDKPVTEPRDFGHLNLDKIN